MEDRDKLGAKKPGRPNYGTIEPIAVSLGDLDVKAGRPRELLKWLGLESEVTPKGLMEETPKEPVPGGPSHGIQKRKPGRPKKVLGASVPVSAGTLPVKRKPGRPPKAASIEVQKRGPGRPKGRAGRPRKVVVAVSKVERGRAPSEGGLLKDYVKRDEAQRLVHEASQRLSVKVFSRLPGLIERELKRLLK